MDIEKLRIKVKIPRGEILEYEINPSDTIRSLQTRLKEVVAIDEKDQQIEINRQISKSPLSRSFSPYWTFGEAQLKDGDTLELYFRTGGFTLFIKTMDGKLFELDASMCDPIWKIKELVQEQAGHPVEKQRIVFAGKHLEDQRTVSYYGMQKDSNMHLVLKP